MSEGPSNADNDNGRIDEIALARIRKQAGCSKAYARAIANMMATLPGDDPEDVRIDVARMILAADDGVLMFQGKAHPKDSNKDVIVQFPRTQPNAKFDISPS